MKNRAVHVMFLKPVSADPLLNRLTGYLGAVTHGVSACHVEVSVPHLNGYMTSSIYNGEVVNVNMTKTFSNPGYDVHTLMVDDFQLSNMKRVMFNLHQRQDSFDAFGMYMACLPVQLPRLSCKNTTFCSKYITEVLQAGNIAAVASLNANITTPSKLLKTIIPASRSTVGSLPHKLQTLEKGGVFGYTRISTT
jgi:hypothetical protein